jgi:hypothetical protein
MRMQEVKSSMISAIGYDEEARTLHVQFPGGRRYEYGGVSPTKHKEFLGAQSVGKHFIEHIRGQHHHRIVTEEEAAKMEHV